MSASYRRGEMRLVLTMPEPWSEYDRNRFIAAVEKAVSAEAGGAPGNVQVTSALLTTWKAEDAKPNGAVDSGQIEKLIIRYGVDEPRLRLGAYEKGKAEGRAQGLDDGRAEGHRDGYAEGLKHGIGRAGNAGLIMQRDYPGVSPSSPPQGRAKVEEPTFDLSPLRPEELVQRAPLGGGKAIASALARGFGPIVDAPPADGWDQPFTLRHTCTNCGQSLAECDRLGCGGAKPSGFRFGPRTLAQEFATAADPALAPLPEPPGGWAAHDAAEVRLIYPHGADSPENVESGLGGSYSPNALDFGNDEPEECEDDACLLRHAVTVDTPHILTLEELDEQQRQGWVCADDYCIDFHYLNDGSEHILQNSGWTERER